MVCSNMLLLFTEHLDCIFYLADAKAHESC